MCLTAVNFASNYDSQSDQFIGVGYKVLNPEGILAPKLNQKKGILQIGITSIC